jgi:hypothetical protein
MTFINLFFLPLAAPVTVVYKPKQWVCYDQF